MGDFEYKVVDAKGQVQKGITSAKSPEDLTESIRAKGYSILDIHAVKGDGAASKAGARVEFSFEPFGVPEKALVFFTRQFSTTLRAGLPMLRSLTTLQAQTSSALLRKTLNDVGNSIQQGQSLAEAMTVHKKVFNPLYLSMMRVGEASGSLEPTVARLADILDKDFVLKRRVKAALVYPVFVLVFSMLIVYAMMAFLMPNFIPIFEHSGLNIRRDYPITQALMDASKTCTDPHFFLGIGGAILLIFVIYKVIASTGPGRLALDTIKFYFPMFSEMIRMATLVRFCRTFATLTHAGVPMLESLNHVATASGNALVENHIKRLSRDVESGGRISVTLAKIPIFPPLLVQMVSIGEETGSLDTMFTRMAEYFEQELDATVTSLASVIEPAMMVVVGIVVGVFVMGVLLPIMGISTAQMNNM